MVINIFHYHLNPGGVTRIIESQITGIRKNNSGIKIRVLCGSCNHPSRIEDLGAEILINEDLNYLVSADSLNKKYTNIRSFLRKTVHKNDIIHFHNLNLGKNPLFTYSVSEMAYDGYKVINHAHDFAEDRAENLDFLKRIIVNRFGKNLNAVMYPDIESYFLAVLNSFDLERLKKTGFSEERTFLLPNPVFIDSSGIITDKEQAKKRVLQQLGLKENKKIIIYPVRVIRRKNIGEFILLSVLFKEEYYWFVTQPPKNPVEIVDYEKWLRFCKGNNINVLFEAGTKADFHDLMLSSDFCITTSIMEGFGMAYLEPWLMGVPVVGRDIQYITKDLKNAGMQYSCLYKELTIHKDGKKTDFKNLDVPEQMKFISEIINDDTKKEELKKMNPFLKSIFNFVPSEMIKKNRQTLTDEFSLEKYGERLNGIYQKIIG